MAIGLMPRKGLLEAKIISVEKMRAITDRLKEYAELKPVYARDLAFVDAASQTALRISEVAHIKKEDILLDGLIVTRRKKKVLTPRTIHVNSAGLDRLREWANQVSGGYVFPGRAGPCLIHRRPKFEVEACPVCKKTVAPIYIMRKKVDRISMFFQHLSIDHQWTVEQLNEWVKSASTQVTQQFCDGGHVSLRAFAKRWMNLMKDLGFYMHGRGVHSVRHASITRMYVQTRDIVATKEFAGHESVEMTKNYTHVDLKEKVQKLPVDW